MEDQVNTDEIRKRGNSEGIQNRAYEVDMEAKHTVSHKLREFAHLSGGKIGKKYKGSKAC